ncbi:MAG: NAD-binding protein [Nannocystaceae bacterium]|nr:NAD-binding protein [Nannocystaceae bacterium]
MSSSRRRLLLLIGAFPLLLVIIALLYMSAMTHLEGETRGFWQSLEWAAETLTTTGYGRDAHWRNPAMILFVVVVQLVGMSVAFLVIPVFVMPYFEERFQGRLPHTAPKFSDFVLIYRFGPAISTLVDLLERAGHRVVILEEDEPVARRLHERGRTVVYANLRDDEPDAELLIRARAIIANGDDDDNGAFVLAARQAGFKGEIIAMAEEPLHRRPMMLAGATAVYTPKHIQAAALVSLATERIAQRVAGLRQLRGKLRIAELRVDAGSELAGSTLRKSDLRRRSGATVIGRWRGGEFLEHPDPDEILAVRSILVVVGSERAVTEAGAMATPLQREGPVLVVGYGDVGAKVAQILRDMGKAVRVLDRVAQDGVDIVGDALDAAVLKRAGAAEACAVVLAVGNDATTLFATAVARDAVADVPIVARVQRSENVQRIHLAGADFGLSLAEVAGEILAHKLLGEEWLSLAQRVKLVRVGAVGLVGKSLREGRIGQRTGCAVVAIEREDDVLVEISDGMVVQADDRLCLCAAEDDVERYYVEFPGSRIAVS